MAEETQVITNNDEGQATEKTYTQAEVDALLQSESDRRVTEALKTQKKKFEEAKKLEQMNDQEKYEYNLKKKEQELLAKEKELATYEIKNQASKILSEKGLDYSLVDFVVAEDAETMMNNIKSLEAAINKAVNKQVAEKLKTSTPKNNVSLPDMITKDDFKKMNLQELAALRQTNPDLFNQLSK